MEDWIPLVVALTSLALGGIVFGIGGVLTPIGGIWTDGDRKILLYQTGPFVVGRCERAGGEERFKGYASFGKLWLTRYATGASYLNAMGFGLDVLHLLENQPLARYTLTLSGHQLTGLFEGRKFSFAHAPARILSVTRLPPQSRVLERVSTI